MHNLTAAIVGTGFMGPVHTEALRRLGISVIGIMGSSPEKSRIACAELGLTKAYESFDAVLQDDEVSAVHLCVPNNLHFDFSKKALLAGKHVMCEKPLAMTSHESAELIDIANRTGVAAGVCYNLRFYPLNFHAREIVSAGEIGRVFHVNGSYVQDWLLYDTDYNWRLLREQSGDLRAVADIGTHWMDMLHLITGLEVEEVFADLKTFHETRKKPAGEIQTYSQNQTQAENFQSIDIDTEDYGCILFRFVGGSTGSLHVSQVNAGRKNTIRYEIAGSKKALSWNSERPNEMWVGNRDIANELLIKDPSLIAQEAAAFASYPGGHNEGYPDTFKQCFKAFYEYIAAGNTAAKPGFPTFADGHREVLLCEAILASSGQEQWTKVGGQV